MRGKGQGRGPSKPQIADETHGPWKRTREASEVQNPFTTTLKRYRDVYGQDEETLAGLC